MSILCLSNILLFYISFTYKLYHTSKIYFRAYILKTEDLFIIAAILVAFVYQFIFYKSHFKKSHLITHYTHL